MLAGLDPRPGVGQPPLGEVDESGTVRARGDGGGLDAGAASGRLVHVGQGDLVTEQVRQQLKRRRRPGSAADSRCGAAEFDSTREQGVAAGQQ